MASKCYPKIGFTFAHSDSISNVIRCKETSASDRKMNTTTNATNEKKKQKKKKNPRKYEVKWHMLLTLLIS